MGKTSSMNRPASRVAYFALLFVTMLAATLHFGAHTAQAAQATLFWAAPTTNTDGTPVTGLSGYKVHIGSSSRSYQQKIDVGKATSYTNSSLSDGSTYYFAVTAYNASGVESAYSNEVSKVFAATSRTITATAGTGGTITALNNTRVSSAGNGTATVTSVTVGVGASQAFSIAPAAGYSIAGVTVDGASIGPVASYNFVNVTADHTISATFAGSTAPTAITSSGTWLNQSIASQSGSFTAKFDLVPNANNIDAVTGFSALAAKTWSDAAAVVRFNNSGTIDARNGSAYAARVALPYSAGKVYHVRMQINVPTHRYDVYVTPAGGAETLLASGYAFRTEQAAVTQLNNLGIYSSVGSHQLRNLSITSPRTITATAGTGGTITALNNTKVSSANNGTTTVTSVTVDVGASQAFSIAPAAGYSIAGVTVDGASIGPVASYNFVNVTADHTISATFAGSTAPTAITSSGTWLNQAIASQSGSFTAKFDLIPNANNIDAVTGFSALAAKTWSDAAAVVRFNSSGTIDARNGSAYAARVALPYSAGKVYHVRMQINVPTHRYDVYVTPAGGAETLLASGSAFRTEQAAVTRINNLGIYSSAGSHQLRNLSIASP